MSSPSENKHTVGMRRFSLGVKSLALALLFVSGGIFADPRAEAVAVVKNITDAVLKQLENRGLYEKDQMMFYRMLDEKVMSKVDMGLMSKLILREHWKTADENQRKRFSSGFKNMLLESYGKSILLLPNIEIKFIQMPEDKKPTKYEIVRTQIIAGTNDSPLSINYYLMKRKEWMIFDLMIGGFSLVKQFRQSFGEEIAETGLNSLIDRLNTNFQESPGSQ